jgi:hypothetical protein
MVAAFIRDIVAVTSAAIIADAADRRSASVSASA